MNRLCGRLIPQGLLQPAIEVLRCPLCAKSRPRALVKRKDALPVVLHADDGPAILLRLVVQRLRKGADLGVGKSLRRTVGVFALRVFKASTLPPQMGAPRVGAEVL